MNACYTGRPSISADTVPKAQNKRKEPYREKSVNDSSNQLCKPLQRDFIAMSRLIPDLYLALPSFVSGPLRRKNVVSRTVRWRGRGGGGGIKGRVVGEMEGAGEKGKGG